MGVKSLTKLEPGMVNHRISANKILTYEEHFPRMASGELLTTDGLVRCCAGLLSRTVVSSVVLAVL